MPAFRATSYDLVSSPGVLLMADKLVEPSEVDSRGGNVFGGEAEKDLPFLWLPILYPSHHLC